jgi:HAD superfamily hydrolase (TIGR01509 family)
MESILEIPNDRSAIKALLFDFDGVVVETEKPGYLVWKQIYTDHGQEPLSLEKFSLVIGTHFIHFDPRKDLESKVGRPLDWVAIDRQRRDFYEKVVSRQPVLPGVRELLQEARAKGIRTGVVSSSDGKWIHRWLQHNDLTSLFERVTCVDDVPTPKPAPDLYLEGLRRFGLRPDQAVAIEDSPNGSKAAERAGLFCVVVPSEITSLLKFEVNFPQVPSLAGMTMAKLQAMKDTYAIKTAPPPPSHPPTAANG